jgi:GDPmannose 4,6-dehydratase
MLQCDTAEDFIIATGVSHSLEEFVQESFAALNLDWRDHTIVSEALLRPSDISDGKGNAAKAERILGWKAKAHMKEVIAMMVRAQMGDKGG